MSFLSDAKDALLDKVPSVLKGTQGVLLKTDYSLFIKSNDFSRAVAGVKDDFEVLINSISLPKSSRMSLSPDNFYNDISPDFKGTLSFNYIATDVAGGVHYDPIAALYKAQFTNEGVFIRPGTIVTSKTYTSSIEDDNNFDADDYLGRMSDWSDELIKSNNGVSFKGSCKQNIIFELKPYNTGSSFTSSPVPIIQFQGCIISLNIGEVAVSGEDLFSNSVEVIYNNMEIYYQEA